MKKFFTPLLLILFASFFVKPILAGNDITITCNSSECSETSGLYLFDETNIYPGFTHSQNFSVINNRHGPCDLTFKANPNSQVPNLLSQKILINISGTNNGYNLTDYLLSDLINSSKPSVSLGHINENSTNNYLWTVTFNSNADNNYQSLSTKSNINFNFECDDESPIPTPTSTSTSNPTSAPVTTQCTNSAPAAPTNLIATSNTNGSVILTWNHSSSTHTGYLIAFGPSSGVYKYGAPDVGNTDNYTVQGLTPGAQYCFYVRSLNGCMPGDRTPEYCVNPGSSVTATNATPPGFQQNILGATTQPTLTEESNNDVLGSQDSCTKHWLPILFLVALLINLIYTRLPTKDKLIPIIISLAAFLLDKFLSKSNCCSGPSWLCHYFWIGSILSWLIPMFIPKNKRNKNRKK